MSLERDSDARTEVEAALRKHTEWNPRLPSVKVDALGRALSWWNSVDLGFSVVNVREANLRQMGYDSLAQWLLRPTHLYIGRARPDLGVPASKWQNPVRLVGRSRGARDDCLKAYEAWVRSGVHPVTGLSRPEGPLFEDLDELWGRVGGCWCAPEPCHGDVLQRLYGEKRQRDNHVPVRRTEDDAYRTPCSQCGRAADPKSWEGGNGVCVPCGAVFCEVCHADHWDLSLIHI